MAVKPQFQFPLFAPPSLCPSDHRPITEIRFSRWNNANAQKFVIPKRTQKQLEDQIRIQKRFDSARTIAENYNPAPPHPTTFKSVGTPSAPSSRSIPGKKSKYSKPDHPAFETLTKSPRKFPATEKTPQISDSPNFKIDENGVSYELPDAPFLYQYSYTETPKLKPVKLREPLVSPFGPTTMAKPWLGRKPLPPSKKKLPEFDSFKLPPPHKKGVKPVQSPGPFLPGSGPKYVKSREEVLGAPLSKEEVEDLINSCKKSSRQLNIGRDGLTHNMLDNIHDLWKRRRVCKIKCKGVCTVDMNTVCQQLEEKTGGKIIYHRGGVIYLFRGRNYNYKSRPRYPLMLWKPIAPVYPRLIKRVPEGLTLEEVTEMRKKGRDLIPICKLAKNGVYCDLVKNVREAFEACELVRINCQGLNPSDYKKIGAKLKDLVPCVLLSFDFEHVLLWRGQDWKSSLAEPIDTSKRLVEVNADPAELGASSLPNYQGASGVEANCVKQVMDSLPNCANGKSLLGEDASTKLGVDGLSQSEDSSSISVDEPDEALEGEIVSNGLVESQTVDDVPLESEIASSDLVQSQAGLDESGPTVDPKPRDKITPTERDDQHVDEGILLLRKQAIESGMVLVLDDGSLDADNVFKEAAAFAKVAPPGPAFPCRPRRAETQLGKDGKSKIREKDQENGNSRQKELPSGLAKDIAVNNRRDEWKTSRNDQLDGVRADYLNVAPKGSLRVDELAKLLA